MSHHQNGVAFTYADLSALEDWRDRLVWPVDTLALREQGARAIREGIAFIGKIEDDLARQILTVGLGAIVNRFQALSEIALVANGAARQSLQIFGGPPELAALARGEMPRARVSEAEAVRSVGRLVEAPRYAFLRQVVRTHSYTPWHRMPRALLATDGVVVSHNKLLIQELRAQKTAAKFVHGAIYLAEVRKHAHALAAAGRDSVSRTHLQGLLEHLVGLVAGLDEPYRGRLLTMLELEVGSEIDKVEADVIAVRKLAKPPEVMWSGTNGAYPIRLIASEVRRRNGEVHGFDHGGVTGITQLAELTSVVELLTTTSFTVATPEWKTLVERSVSPSVAKPLNSAAILSGHGEPMFRAAFRDGRSASPAKPRVIYVGHPYRGLRQFAIAALPDSVYWDFQERLVTMLQGMEVELLCKPHPEGVFRGGKMPIEELAQTSYKRFEEHLDDADVFLFDAPTSTTFMESLCTRKPVVLIDRGHYPFSDGVWPHIQKRCTIVKGTNDERGRLCVDRDELAAALSNLDYDPDPSWFRTLLTGAPV